MKLTKPLFFLFFFLAFCNQVLFAQVVFEKYTNSSGNSVCPTADGGYLVAGSSDVTAGDGLPGNNPAASYFLVEKTDYRGNPIWSSSIGLIKGSYCMYKNGANAVIETKDGGCLATGFFGDDEEGTICNPASPQINGLTLVVRYNSKGDTIWSKQIFFSTIVYNQYAIAYSMDTTDHGGFVITGYGSFARFDSSGNLVASSSAGGYSVHETSDGGYVEVTNIDNNNDNYSVRKTDNMGNTLWAQSPNYGYSQFYSVCTCSDGGFVAAGSEIVSGYTAGNLVKLDANGNILWSKAFGGAYASEIQWAQETSDHGFIFAGRFNHNFYGTNGVEDSSRVWLGKTDAGGNIIWSREMGLSLFNGIGYCVKQAKDGGYIISGNSGVLGPSPFYQPQLSGYLAKTDSQGLITPHCEAAFTLSPDPVIPHLWYAENESKGMGPASFTWIWGDGYSDVGDSVTHTYADSGFYQICLLMQDDTACQSDYCTNATIYRIDGANSMVTVKTIKDNNLTLSTGALLIPDSIKLIANPCHECFLTGASDISKIRITDLLGRNVPFTYSGSGNRYIVDFPNSSVGMYLLQDMQSGKVIKFIKE